MMRARVGDKGLFSHESGQQAGSPMAALFRPLIFSLCSLCSASAFTDSSFRGTNITKLLGPVTQFSLATEFCFSWRTATLGQGGRGENELTEARLPSPSHSTLRTIYFIYSCYLVQPALSNCFSQK